MQKGERRMKVKELIKELKKYDGELEVEVFKQPKRSVNVVTHKVKHIGKTVDGESKEIKAVNIAY